MPDGQDIYSRIMALGTIIEATEKGEYKIFISI